MKLAIIHYHLNRGGVTSVIVNHLRSLAAADPQFRTVEAVLVLHGGRRDAWPMDFPNQYGHIPLELVACPGLEYDSHAARGAHGDDLAASLREILTQRQFAADQTLIHCHNHNLGKNSQLPDALRQLAKDGFSLLLQIHDFAEDYRPENYGHLQHCWSTSNATHMASRLYPRASQIHYAVLNGRDRQVLQRCFGDAERIHFLPNPVPTYQSLPDRSASRTKLQKVFSIPQNQPLVLYPVRGIRRKNLGELLLWAAAHPQTAFGITLQPVNPTEQVSYQRWQLTAAKLGLNVYFGMGDTDDISFCELLSCSDWLITTSIAEGFGMVYLEGWQMGRPLLGRDLPAITADFQEAGLRYPWCYRCLMIPIQWIVDLDCYGRRWLEAVGQTRRRYGIVETTEPTGESYWNTIAERGAIDFAQLDFQRQQQIIQAVQTSDEKRHALHRLNPTLSQWQHASIDEVQRVVDHNRRAVTRSYSETTSGKRLLQAYRLTHNCSRSAVVDGAGGEKILLEFLHPATCYPIRFES